MTSHFKKIELSGVDLVKYPSLRRKDVRPPDRRASHYLERYDYTTLFYDCFYQPQKGCFVFTAPRFLNLWPIFKKNLRINGNPLSGRIKRYRWQRCEQVEIYTESNARLSIQLEEDEVSIHTRPSEQSLFTNMNVAVAMNKNNRIEWIVDWVTYHIRAQQLEGVCIIDNSSTDYSTDDLIAALENIPDLKAALVVSSPFPYGPVSASRKLEVSPRFLQTAMLNLVKRDAFNHARAILSVDIDELVTSFGQKNVFDAAVDSKLGAVSFRELRVYAREQDDAEHRHASHTKMRLNAKPGNTKWCVSGSGFMNNFGWAVHRFGGGFFPFTETSKFQYLHCQATTTNWKANRTQSPEDLVDCAVAEQAFNSLAPHC
ncbi:MAG: hypothetical protein JXQ97_15435 [Natronospirillum sp.]